MPRQGTRGTRRSLDPSHGIGPEGRAERKRPVDPLFSTRKGRRLSRDAVEQRLAKHDATAALTCEKLQTKKITPHTLRHTTAMTLLHAGDVCKVSAL
ncbi:tyrosine-type recombinase/integrase [Paeniglutamicibacter sp. ZC-3]|nr:tyrosine-type recombinase/integrase [Paeniglutamicibacter sp. ZC-3]MCV9996609.1 tyrosine-type recombinase/integrase [Paeniglutamicibacter sp. ZC-3]